MHTTDDEGAPTRDELIRARNQIQRQIAIIHTPAITRDRNPALEAKLRAMVNEIDECLAALERDNP
jgi:hypothetical protein